MIADFSKADDDMSIVSGF